MPRLIDAENYVALGKECEMRLGSANRQVTARKSLTSLFINVCEVVRNTILDLFCKTSRVLIWRVK